MTDSDDFTPDRFAQSQAGALARDLASRTLRALEWDKLKEHLAREAVTEDGRKLCLNAELYNAPAVVQAYLDETAEAVSLLNGASGLYTEGLPKLDDALGRLKAGSQLSAQELNGIKTMLLLARASRNILSLVEKEHFPKLTQFLDRLYTLDPLVVAIADAIDDEHEVKDHASKELAQLRKDVKRLDSQIRADLTRIIHSSTLSKALQEPIYTQRAGRYVLPVNASMRTSIAGIVHDSSASGLTVYVEPAVVVELSNKIRIKETEIEREIARLLTELSCLARTEVGELLSNYEALVEIDFVMARGKLSRRLNASKPELSADGLFHVRAARHPLLVLQNQNSKTAVVENDITLGGTGRTMVVTGPNTGGKTVLLKTVGLLSLMLRAGLLIPAERGSTAYIYNEVFADIGDEQSLEQSLSTFSSHMTNIVEIVRRSDKNTLVLLDEIGAGTDPREGSALARAVLEELNRSGAATIVTTHFGELKSLAYSHVGFVNASLEFDEGTLSPTYRLRMGVPGTSKATSIARRLVLKPEVVSSAEAYLKQDERDFDRVVEQLETNLKDVLEQKESLSQLEKQAKRLEKEAEAKLDALTVEEAELRESYRQEIETEFKNAREYIRALVAELQKKPDSRQAEIASQEVKHVQETLKWLAARQVAGNAALNKLSVGQRVKVISLNQIAVIDDLPAELTPQSLVSLRLGNFKMKLPAGDLQALAPETTKKTGLTAARTNDSAVQRSGANRSYGNYKAARRMEEDTASLFVRTDNNTITLLGKRVDEAIPMVERFIDSNMLSGSPLVMIIHGHGTGALKSAVRDYLKNSNQISSFRSGEIHEGGDGVTVVEL